MGTVFKQKFTNPLPPGAEIITLKGETVARVKPPKGRAVTFPLTTGRDGSQRNLIQATTYSARYRDGAGIVRTVATGCRDEDAARSVLADLERRAELVRSGVLTAAEDRIADHAATLIGEHLDGWLTSLKAGGCSVRHLEPAHSGRKG